MPSQINAELRVDRERVRVKEKVKRARIWSSSAMITHPTEVIELQGKYFGYTLTQIQD